MNPQLFFEIDFSFFKRFFPSKEDEEEKKENKKNSKNVNKANISIKNSNKLKLISNKEKDNLIRKNEKLEKEANGIKEDKKNNIKNKEIKKDINKEKENIKKEKKIKKEKLSKDEYLINLVNYIKLIYLYRKQVKNLIKKAKDNYAIISSVNNNNLHMNIFLNDDKIKKLKYTYEPILNENIFYIPRKSFKKKNLLKFSFINNKNESIIDPKFNTEYDSGEFINVINLKKIKDKEAEREEEFQTFLESYYTLNPTFSKDIRETKKMSLGIVRVKKKHKTMEHKVSFAFGMQKFLSKSILKQRPMKRVASNKKITFSENNETISYIKDE